MVKSDIEEDLNNMTTQIDKLLKSINNEFANHNIISIFNDYLLKINNILIEKNIIFIINLIIIPLIIFNNKKNILYKNLNLNILFLKKLFSEILFCFFK